MDIERLKKLNALAGELKHQGIASNHEDAAFLAVTMVGESEEQALSDMHINDDQSLVIREIIKDKPQVKHEEHVEEIKQEQTTLQAQPSEDVAKQIQQSMKNVMTRDETQAIMQNFATQIVNEFNALQQKIEQNNAQLAKLAQQLSGLSLSQQRPTQEVPVQRTIQDTQPTQPAAQPQSAGNPRTGSFAANDVAIEKMFYFGAKR
ncbi:hypothetical protein HZC31_01440 [Candidatus Woesearchaeota archaeon]|nr:hypothetical protein [Candidatus Woesearchaeota archaeon]